MRRLIAVFALAGFLAVANAEDPKKDEPKKDDKPKLKVGDPAPALKADKWLQGPEVKEFASGKVYVVEFWATWCGPCIVMMPHMAEMQLEFRDKGVTFIGYTAKDPGNTEQKVTEFVSKRGPKLGYTFAYGANRDTYDAWMTAAKQGGIPCSYVIDQKGKIAYIGHPMYLDLVLPKVVAGAWAEGDVKQLEDVEKDINKLFQTVGRPNADAEAGLKALSDFDAKYPKLAKIPYFVPARIGMCIKAKRFDDAKKIAEEISAKAISNEDPMALRMVSGALQEAKDQKDLLALSVKAALTAQKMLGDKDAIALVGVAEAYFAAGDKAKAREFGAKAVAVAEPRMKQALERHVKRYEEEEKKDDKKDDKKKEDKK